MQPRLPCVQDTPIWQINTRHGDPEALQSSSVVDLPSRSSGRVPQAPAEEDLHEAKRTFPGGSGGRGKAETQAIWGGSGHTGLKWGLRAKPRAAAGHAAPHNGVEQPRRKNMRPALVFALPHTRNLKLYRSI